MKIFRKYSVVGRDFCPQDLESTDLKKRLAAREIVVKFLKDAGHVSNSNLVRNANNLLTSGNAKINPEEQLTCIGKSG